MKTDTNRLLRFLKQNPAMCPVKYLLGGLLLTLSLLPQPARAQSTTYTYTGAPFSTYGVAPITQTNFYSCNAGLGECAISGSFTLAAPLGDNYSGGITPISFSFTDGANTITQNSIAGSPYNIASFNVTTNASGQISQWNIGLIDYTNKGLVQIDSMNLLQLSFRHSNDSTSMGNQQATLNYGYAAGPSGQWSIADPAAISATPEPSGIVLLGTGAVLGVCLILWRRKHLA